MNFICFSREKNGISLWYMYTMCSTIAKEFRCYLMKYLKESLVCDFGLLQAYAWSHFFNSWQAKAAKSGTELSLLKANIVD